MPNGVEVALIHPFSGRTKNGDLKPDLPVLEAKRCIVWPRTSNSDSERGEVIIEGKMLYIPPGQPIPTDAKDEVTVQGTRYSVDGAPGTYSKAGVAKGTVVALMKAGT